MTEAQIEAAIESMCIDVRPADPHSPSGLSKHSRLGRRLREQRSIDLGCCAGGLPN
jgi:hypothetical protein